MDRVVAVPSLWGDKPCVVLPAPRKGESAEDWEKKSMDWIRKLAAMSPMSPPPEAA